MWYRVHFIIAFHKKVEYFHDQWFHVNNVMFYHTIMSNTSFQSVWHAHTFCFTCTYTPTRQHTYRFEWSHNDVIKWKHFPRYWPLCREFTGDRWIPHTKPMTRSFDVSCDLRLNKRLSKQWWGWWFETSSCSLWRHPNEHLVSTMVYVLQSFNVQRIDLRLYHRTLGLCYTHSVESGIIVI